MTQISTLSVLIKAENYDYYQAVIKNRNKLKCMSSRPYVYTYIVKYQSKNPSSRATVSRLYTCYELTIQI